MSQSKVLEGGAIYLVMIVGKIVTNLFSPNAISRNNLYKSGADANVMHRLR